MKNQTGICPLCGNEKPLINRRDGSKSCKYCASKEATRRSLAKKKDIENLRVPDQPGYYVSKKQKNWVFGMMNCLSGWEFNEEYNVWLKPGLKWIDEESGEIMFKGCDNKSKMKKLVIREDIKKFYEDLLLARKLRADGKKFREISEETGLSMQNINTYIRYTTQEVKRFEKLYQAHLKGIDTKINAERMKVIETPDIIKYYEQVMKIRQMREEGVKFQEIIEKTGVSVRKIYLYIRFTDEEINQLKKLYDEKKIS